MYQAGKNLSQNRASHLLSLSLGGTIAGPLISHEILREQILGDLSMLRRRIDAISHLIPGKFNVLQLKKLPIKRSFIYVDKF